MGFFRMMMRSVIKPFADYGRYLDLFFAAILLTLAFFWSSILLACLGIFSFAMFAIDLNGKMQRWAMRSAITKSVGR